MSVITTPSTAHTPSWRTEPGPVNCDCWPLSLPPTLMRSVWTPGTVWSTAQGSRAEGIFSSSTWLTVVPAVILRESSSGLSEVTVMVSSMAGESLTSSVVLRLMLIVTFG